MRPSDQCKIVIQSLPFAESFKAVLEVGADLSMLHTGPIPGSKPLLFQILAALPTIATIRTLLFDPLVPAKDGRLVTAVQHALSLHPDFLFSRSGSLLSAVLVGKSVTARQHREAVEFLFDNREFLTKQVNGDVNFVGRAGDVDSDGNCLFDLAPSLTRSIVRILLEAGAPPTQQLFMSHTRAPALIQLMIQAKPQLLAPVGRTGSNGCFFELIKSLALSFDSASIYSTAIAVRTILASPELRTACTGPACLDVIRNFLSMFVTGETKGLMDEHNEGLTLLFGLLDVPRLEAAAKRILCATQRSMMNWEIEKVDPKMPPKNSCFGLLADSFCIVEQKHLNETQNSILMPADKISAPTNSTLFRLEEFDDSYMNASDFKAGMITKGKNSVHVVAYKIIQVMSRSSLFPQVIGLWNKHNILVLHACVLFSHRGLGTDAATKAAYQEIRLVTANVLLAAGIDTNIQDPTGKRAVSYSIDEEVPIWVPLIQKETSIAGMARNK